MNPSHVFVSVGGTANDTQEAFVRAVEDRLRAEGLVPHTVGRNTFSAESPFRAVSNLLDECAGMVVIALERVHVQTGSEKRGGPGQKPLVDARLATPWNQIEATMAYCRKMPLLVLVEQGLRGDGLLEKGFDWYVHEVELSPASLSTPVFNGVLADWRQKLSKTPAATAVAAATLKPAEMTVGQLLGALKPAQFWSVLVALGASLAGAFALGAKLFR